MAHLRRVSRMLVVGLLILGMGAAAATLTNAGAKGRSLVVRTVPVCAGPFAVVVDESVGDAFVACLSLTVRGMMIPSGTPTARVSTLATARGVVVRTVILSKLYDVVAEAVDSETGRVFVVNRGLLGATAGHNGAVDVLDARTGAVQRTSAVGTGPVALAVAQRTRRVFVVNEGPLGRGTFPTGRGAVSVLDARTGVVLRTVVVGKGPQAVAVAQRAGRVFVLNSVGHSVTMLDARTGQVVRTVMLPAGAYPIAAAVDERIGHVFVVNAVGTVNVLAAGTGTILRTVSVGAFTYLPPAIAVDARAGRVYVANHNRGTVKVLDAVTGAVRRTTAVGRGPIALAVDEPLGRVLVVNRGSLAGFAPLAGTVSVLDAASGRVVRAIRVGPGPVAIGLDLRVGCAFVANSGDDTVSVLRLAR